MRKKRSHPESAIRTRHILQAGSGRFAALLFSAIVASSGAGAVHAQGNIRASPDVTIELRQGLLGGASVVAADEDMIVHRPFGIVQLESFGPIPEASEVIALAVDVNGDRLMAFETTTLLAGGVVARPGDVVRYSGGVLYSIEFDASAAGLPSTVATDAVSISGDLLMLSFDTTVDLGVGRDRVVADEDVVSWDGRNLRRALDGSALGIDSALDIDAIHFLGGTPFLASFDTTGEVGGVVFDDEDVLRFNGFFWSMEFDGSATNSAWAAADLDAFFVPEPGFIGMVGAGCGLLVGLNRRRGRTGPNDGRDVRKPEEQWSC